MKKQKLLALLLAVLCTGGISRTVLTIRGGATAEAITLSNKAQSQYSVASKEEKAIAYTQDSLPEEITVGEDIENIEKLEENKEVKEEVKEEEIKPAINIDKYTSLANFIVTSNNKIYDLSNNDKELLTAIVAAESDKSYDDALAVISVILNRCENSSWIRSYGTDPVNQATAPNQFVVYQHGYYKKYMGYNVPNTVKEAVSDALMGVRNNEFLSFRSNGSTNYSKNMITKTGNRYK